MTDFVKPPTSKTPLLLTDGTVDTVSEIESSRVQEDEERSLYTQNLFTAPEHINTGLQPIRSNATAATAASAATIITAIAAGGRFCLLPCWNYGSNSNQGRRERTDAVERGRRRGEEREEEEEEEGDGGGGGGGGRSGGRDYERGEDIDDDSVYRIPGTPRSSSPTYRGPQNVRRGRINEYILQLLERWIIGIVRRHYNTRAAYIFSTILTIGLISTILILYFTGHLDIIVNLSRDLLCELIHQFNSTSPKFCKFG